MKSKAPQSNKSVFREPIVVVAIIGLIGTVITAIIGPIIVEKMTVPTVTPVIPLAIVDTASVPTPTNFQPTNDTRSAEELLADAKNWPLVMYDTFDTNNANWLDESFSTENVEGEQNIQSGQYFWRVKGLVSSPTRWSIPKAIDPVQGFYASVKFQRLADLNDLRVGMIFRYQGNYQFYDFMVYMDKHLTIRLYDENDETPQTTATLATLPANAVDPNSQNKLTIIGLGNDYWFYINDQFVHQLHDEQFTSGTVGLILGVKEIGQEAWVAFDDFELRKAP